MIELDIDFSILEVNNPNFELIYVVSKITKNGINQIDCSKYIEKETRKNFITKYNNELKLVEKDIYWFTRKNLKSLEALVVLVIK